MGSNVNVIISVLFDGENISFEASLVMYINSTSIPPIIIMNRIYEIKIFCMLFLSSDGYDTHRIFSKLALFLSSEASKFACTMRHS